MEGRVVRRVLVIDDDPRVLSSLQRGFVARRRECTTASNAATGLSLARVYAPDLALVDLKLGRDSGLELVRHLRAAVPDVAIVLLSGYLSVATAVSGVRAGADHVLFKPMRCEDILARVELGTAADPDSTDETPTLKRVEWEHISRVMEDCNGNVSMAAKRLGMLRQSLQRKLRKLPPPA